MSRVTTSRTRWFTRHAYFDSGLADLQKFALELARFGLFSFPVSATDARTPPNQLFPPEDVVVFCDSEEQTTRVPTKSRQQTNKQMSQQINEQVKSDSKK